MTKTTIVAPREVFGLPVRRKRAATRTSTLDRLEALKAECAELQATLDREQQERRFWVDNRDALLDLGSDMLKIKQRSAFLHAGCVAGILGCIAAGRNTRDDIVTTIPHHHNCTRRHVAFLLDRLSGDDPAVHLWFKGDDRQYRLHPALNVSSAP